MRCFADLDTNSKVIGVKEVNDDYINPGNSIEIQSFDDRLMGTTYNNEAFEGYYIVLSADKTVIKSDGVDKTTITATVYKWDDTQAMDYATGIVFDVNGTQQSIAPTNGVASIEFTSSLSGDYIIKTVNDVIKNGEVVISAN